MGQLKDFIKGLTLTDGVADAQAVRVHTRPTEILFDKWDYRQTMDNLFIRVGENDYGSLIRKDVPEALPNLLLRYSNGEEGNREDAAFLLGAALLDWGRDEYLHYTVLKNFSDSSAEYISAFASELVLPERNVRKMYAGLDEKDERLVYSRIRSHFGVSTTGLYVRLKELELL